MTVNLQASVGRNKYNLSCEENEQVKIAELAQRLNKRVNLLSMVLGRLSDTVLLFLTGIIIQRELDIAKNETSGKFYDYLIQSSKKINAILPATALLNDKDERNRLFISCLNLENELYVVSDGKEVDYLQKDSDMGSLTKGTESSNEANYMESEEYQNQVNDIINFFEDLTDNTNRLSARIKDC